MNAVAAVALALASVVAYAGGAAIQHRVASSAPAPTRRGALRLLADGAWWTAVTVNTVGALLHAGALNYGPLTLVQPLGALTLVAAVPLGARSAGRRVSRHEWRGIALVLGGFGALLPLTAGGAGHTALLGVPAALGVAAVAGLAALLARSVPDGRSRMLAHAAASGIASAAGSALAQTVIQSADAFSWRTVALGVLAVGLAVGGLLLSQAAYTGGLGAPLAVLTLANPLASAAIGLTLLGEGIQGGLAGAAVAAAGAAVASYGIVLLARPRTAEPETTPEPAEAVKVRHVIPSRKARGSRRARGARTDRPAVGALAGAVAATSAFPSPRVKARSETEHTRTFS